MNTSSEDEVLDECIEAVRAGGDADRVLARHPEAAGAIRPLVALAVELGSLPAPSPNVAGLMRTVARLAAGNAAVPPRRAVRFFSRPVMLRAAAAILVLLLLGWGTVNASSTAVPGDILYPVKLLTERVRFALVMSREHQAELRIVFSEERLKDAVKKQQASGEVDPALLAEMLSEAEAALHASLGLPTASRELLAARVACLSGFQARTLERLKAGADPQTAQVLDSAIDACRERCGRAEMMSGGCEDGRRHDGCTNASHDRPAGGGQCQ